ncbi:MAG: hypothetical protein BMS9Abin37_3030 [Acidobacteriota bacterium]|nr:MAG: hypothetical protein BMS9Abin37_3030 [Acidobacteriota bacterium]
MSVDRNRVRALVRAELERRLHSKRPPSLGPTPALLEIYQGSECSEDSEFPIPCVIEPDRPCNHSGYCKKLGY